MNTRKFDRSALRAASTLNCFQLYSLGIEQRQRRRVHVALVGPDSCNLVGDAAPYACRSKFALSLQSKSALRRVDRSIFAASPDHQQCRFSDLRSSRHREPRLVARTRVHIRNFYNLKIGTASVHAAVCGQTKCICCIPEQSDADKKRTMNAPACGLEPRPAVLLGKARSSESVLLKISGACNGLNRVGRSGCRRLFRTPCKKCV